jgi:hypothetical protein
VEACRESPEERDVRLVADRRPYRVHTQAQFMAQGRRDPGKEVEINVWGSTRLDSPDLGMRDADHQPDSSRAQPRGDPCDP